MLPTIIDDSIAAIESIIDSGNDPWEALIGAGIQAQERMDSGRWRIGDLALLVDKKYREDRLGEFSKSIKVRVGRVREYRTVCRFWDREISARAELLEYCPNLEYSHFRLAIRLKHEDKAVAFLEECSAKDWSVEAAGLVLKKLLGKPLPPKKLIDLEVFITSIKDDYVTFALSLDAVKVLTPYLSSNTPVRIRVHEIEGREISKNAAV